MKLWRRELREYYSKKGDIYSKGLGNKLDKWRTLQGKVPDANTSRQGKSSSVWGKMKSVGMNILKEKHTERDTA